MTDGPSWIALDARAAYRAVELSWKHKTEMHGPHWTGRFWDLRERYARILGIERTEHTDNELMEKLEKLVEAGALRVSRDCIHGDIYMAFGSLLEAIAWASR